MKLHISACNGHRQVSTTIKKSTYKLDFCLSVHHQLGKVI